MDMLSLSKDISRDEMDDLNIVRAHLNKNAPVLKALSPRAVALAMIEVAINDKSATPKTPTFAALAGLENSKYVDVIREELKRLEITGNLEIDLGSSYLNIRCLDISKSNYRHGSIRAYFQGEPISPTA